MGYLFMTALMPQELPAYPSDDIRILGGEADPAQELSDVIHPVGMIFRLEKVNLQEGLLHMRIHALKFKGGCEFR